MTRRPAQYALVQFCPDAGRDEAMNVGVIMWSDDAIGGKNLWTAFSSRDTLRLGWELRLIHWFPSEKLTCVATEAQGVLNALYRGGATWTRREELQHFIDTLANRIRITPLRPMVMHASPGEEIETLWRDLVRDPELPK